MKNFTNNVHVEGYVFNHDLESRVSRDGNTHYIVGNINVAISDDGAATVPVRFYATPTYRSGKENPNYGVLQEIMNAVNGTYEACGTAAMKVRIDGSVASNDFYNRQGELVSPKQINGSFVHFMTTPIREDPATFEIDTLITVANDREVDDGQDYLQLKGWGFNYRNDIFPIELSVVDVDGIRYFEDQEISGNEPLLTKVWGRIEPTTISRTVSTGEQSAFGTPKARTTSRTIRAWNVTGCSVEPMVFDDPSTITRAEFDEKHVEYEARLAQIRERTLRDRGGSLTNVPDRNVSKVAANNRIPQPAVTASAYDEPIPF